MMNWILIFTFLTAHDFHVSRTEVRHNAVDHILEASLHIFIDDLELALKDYSSDALRVGTKMESTQADSLIHEYISDHLGVLSGGVLLSWNFVGKETTDDLSAIWVHMYTEWDGGGELAMINTILLETYDDQKNIIEYTDADERVTRLSYRDHTRFILKE